MRQRVEDANELDQLLELLALDEDPQLSRWASRPLEGDRRQQRGDDATGAEVETPRAV
jgi:hypothetical protein